jgi:hypothetical protein
MVEKEGRVWRGLRGPIFLSPKKTHRQWPINILPCAGTRGASFPGLKNFPFYNVKLSLYILYKQINNKFRRNKVNEEPCSFYMWFYSIQYYLDFSSLLNYVKRISMYAQKYLRLIFKM